MASTLQNLRPGCFAVSVRGISHSVGAHTRCIAAVRDDRSTDVDDHSHRLPDQQQTTAIFGDLSSHFFGNFRDKASNIISVAVLGWGQGAQAPLNLAQAPPNF